MGSRFFNKVIKIHDGFSVGQDDDSPACFFNGDTLVVTRPLAVEGAITGSAITFNAGTVGSLAVTNLRVGSSVGNNLITALWKTTYTWNMGAIPGIVGSTNSVISVDVAMSGLVIGDSVIANAIGSVDTCVNYAAAVSSAANVQLRAWYTGSTGAYTPGNVPFKITAIKV